MKVSTKGRYALRIMADIAIHQDLGNVSIKDLSNRNKISCKYLEQIISLLVKNDLLISSRGSNGGYVLSRDAKDITVAHIMNATEGGLETVACLDGNHKCDLSCSCLTANVWAKLEKIVYNFFNSTTLSDVVNKKV